MKRATEDLYYTDPINWSETEVHKMLGVPADACRAIRNKQIELSEYKRISERYPNLPLGKLIARNRIVRSQYGTLDSVLRDTGLSDAKLFKYLKGQPDVTLSDFYDYLRQAKRLGYDFSDKSVVAPKSIAAAHDRLNVIEQALVQERIAKKPEQQQSEFQKHMKKRKSSSIRTVNILSVSR